MFNSIQTLSYKNADKLFLNNYLIIIIIYNTADTIKTIIINSYI